MVHNNKQKTVFWSREVSEPRSVDTFLVNGEEKRKGEKGGVGKL
jgi:hypothetical protein